MEHGFFQHGLQGSREIAVPERDLGVFVARWPEDLRHLLRENIFDSRHAIFPDHVDAIDRVREILGVQLEETVGLQLYDRPQTVLVDRLAERGETHDLALVPVLREPEELRDHGVEDPDRVGEEHLLEDLDLGSDAVSDERRGEVAEAVDREHGRLVPARREECARDVRQVVGDLLELGQVVLAHAELAREHGAHVAELRDRLEALLDLARVSGPAGEDLEDLLADVLDRLGRDRDRVHLADVEAALLEAVADRLDREARGMLYPVEALLLDRGDDPSVLDERGRCVGVVRVEAEDRGHGLPPGALGAHFNRRGARGYRAGALLKALRCVYMAAS